jgi:5'-nucleotidase
MRSKLGKVAAMLVCGAMLGVATLTDAFKLLIMHTNDMHSRFQETSKTSGVCSEEEARGSQCYGGFARVSEAVKLARSRAKMDETQSLFLIAGDIYQGTLLYTFYKWQIVARLTNMLKPDAMVRAHFDFLD